MTNSGDNNSDVLQEASGAATATAPAPEESKAPPRLPAIPETRALRYDPPAGADEATLVADMEKIADHGFNTVVVSAFRRGHTLFPSRAMKSRKLPLIHPSFRRRDPLGEIFNIAEPLGLSIFGHVEILHVASDPIHGGPVLKRFPGWGMRPRLRRAPLRGMDSHRYFLDPSNEAARRLIGDVFYEMTEAYPVAGVYFNDLRYPRGLITSAQSRMARDVERFVASRPDSVGRDALSFATEDESTGRLFQELLEWRNEQINDMLRYLHCRLERANARVWIVSQAVGPYRPERFRDELQGDWGLWVNEQYVDGVVPRYKEMDDEAFFEAVQGDFARLPEDRALYPLLDAIDIREPYHRVDVCRRLPLTGLMFRSFADLEAPDWERLKEWFARPARPTEERPYSSARWALMECRRILDKRPDLAAFFDDILKVVPANPGPRGAVIDPRLARSVARNLRSLEDKMSEGSIELAPEERAARRWVGLARRCLAIAVRH